MNDNARNTRRLAEPDPDPVGVRLGNGRNPATGIRYRGRCRNAGVIPGHHPDPVIDELDSATGPVVVGIPEEFRIRHDDRTLRSQCDINSFCH